MVFGITHCGLHLSMVAASPLTIAMRPGLWCFVKRSGSPSLLKSLNPVSSCFFFILHISSSISVAVESMLIWRCATALLPISDIAKSFFSMFILSVFIRAAACVVLGQMNMFGNQYHRNVEVLVLYLYFFYSCSM